MTELFNITHDADNLNEYDSTVTDGGDLSTGTPGLAGTSARMEALIDDTTTIYGRKNVSAPASQLRIRIYLDPSGLTMAGGDIFTILSVNASASPTTWTVILLRYDGSSFEIRLNMRSDDGSNNLSGDYDISDAEHYIEVHLTRASSDVANDATAELFIDGVSQEELTGIDAYDVWDDVTHLRLGAVAGIDAGTSGTFLLDEFVANDDGGEIGPVRKIAVIVHHLRQQGIM